MQYVYLLIFNAITLTDKLHGNYIRTICELTGKKIKNKRFMLRLLNIKLIKIIKGKY